MRRFFICLMSLFVYTESTAEMHSFDGYFRLNTGQSVPYIESRRISSSNGDSDLVTEIRYHLMNSTFPMKNYTNSGRTYFLGEIFFKPSKVSMTAQICSFHLFGMEVMTTLDGVEINELIFECSLNERCCGLQCCPRSESGFTWWLVVLAILGVFMINCFLWSLLKRNKLCPQRTHTSEVIYTVPPVNTISINVINIHDSALPVSTTDLHDLPPSYSELHQPPSYEVAMSNLNLFKNV